MHSFVSDLPPILSPDTAYLQTRSLAGILTRREDQARDQQDRESADRLVWPIMKVYETSLRLPVNFGAQSRHERLSTMTNTTLDFTGKVALVTGAASGMGLATAQAFAEAGAAVVLADFRADVAKAEARKLAAAGHRVIAIGCDVSDETQVEQMVERTVSEFGRLDAAFNNAGVMAHIAATADSTREDWDRVIGINLRGVWSCMKYELRQMERQGNGTIVNNASVGALTGNPGIGSYIASK